MALKHMASTLSIKKKSLTSNGLGIICAGVSTVSGHERNA